MLCDGLKGIFEHGLNLLYLRRKELIFKVFGYAEKTSFLKQEFGTSVITLLLLFKKCGAMGHNIPKNWGYSSKAKTNEETDHHEKEKKPFKIKGML